MVLRVHIFYWIMTSILFLVGSSVELSLKFPLILFANFVFILFYSLHFSVQISFKLSRKYENKDFPASPSKAPAGIRENRKVYHINPTSYLAAI